MEWSPPVRQVAPGWYPDDRGVTRYWDGARWTEHVAPPAYPQVVVHQPTYMVTRTRKQTSHTFHLLMTILTFGMWGLFVWLPITIYNSMRHDKARTRIY